MSTQATAESPLTDEERTILETVRGTGIDFKSAIKAIYRAIPVPKGEPPPYTPLSLGKLDLTTAEARPLALRILRTAHRDWRLARARTASAFRRFKEAADERPAPRSTPDDNFWQRCCDVLVDFEHDAQQRLIAAVLLIHGRIREPKDIRTLGVEWKPAAVVVDNWMHVVAPGERGQLPDGSSDAVLTVFHDRHLDTDNFGRGLNW